MWNVNKGEAKGASPQKEIWKDIFAQMHADIQEVRDQQTRDNMFIKTIVDETNRRSITLQDNTSSTFNDIKESLHVCTRTLQSLADDSRNLQEQLPNGLGLSSGISQDVLQKLAKVLQKLHDGHSATMLDGGVDETPPVLRSILTTSSDEDTDLDGSTQITDATEEVEDLRNQLADQRTKNIELTKQRDAAADWGEELLQQLKTAQEMTREATVMYDSLNGNHEVLKERYEFQILAYNRMFEQLQDLLGCVRVACRIRPVLECEADEPLKDFGPRDQGVFGNWSTFRIPEEEKGAIGIRRTTKVQELERIFESEATNNDVFNDLSTFLQAALEGKKVTVFAYGPSGTGKSHTLTYQTNPTEPGKQDGLIPKTMAMVFDYARQASHDSTFSFEISFVEVFGEEYFDMLKPGKPKDRLMRLGQERWDPVSNWGSAMSHISSVLKNRRSAPTKANPDSSRSHLAFGLRIRRTPVDGNGGDAMEGLLNLVDLAGSEKLDNDASEHQKKESEQINLSLSDLLTMIRQLGRGDTPTPSRALGKLLRPAFCKGGRVLMLTTVSPLAKHYKDHTRPTLYQADEVHKSRNVAKSRLAIGNVKKTNNETRPEGPPGTTNTTPRSQFSRHAADITTGRAHQHGSSTPGSSGPKASGGLKRSLAVRRVDRKK